jgi:hypothetical protein
MFILNLFFFTINSLEDVAIKFDIRGYFRDLIRIEMIGTANLPRFNYDDYVSYLSQCIRLYGVNISSTIKPRSTM